jgi:hypothetical protein
MLHTMLQTAGDLDLGSKSAGVSCESCLHRMPLLQSAVTSFALTLGNKEEFL